MVKLTSRTGISFLVDTDIANEISGHTVTSIKQGGNFYIYVYISGKCTPLHRFIMKGECDGLQVDHINRDTLDNRRENLRVCTHQENTKNQGKRKRNTSGYKGVFKHGTHKKWMARIESDCKGYYLGSYETKESAAQAYDRAAIKLHGKFAALNFPLSTYDNEE